MGYKNFVVTNNGKEKDFAEAILTALTQADSRISRDQTTEEIQNSYQKTFSFTINEDAKITFGHNNPNSADSYFDVRFSYNNQELYSFLGYTNGLYYTDNSVYSDATTARTIKFQIISNDKALFIRLGNRDDTLPLTSNKIALVYNDGSKKFLASAPNGTYYVGTDSTRATKVTRLPYIKNTDDITQVEVIKSCILVTENSNEELLEINGLWDATTNYTTNVPLKIGTEECCFLDTNTVMKYKEE